MGWPWCTRDTGQGSPGGKDCSQSVIFAPFPAFSSLGTGMHAIPHFCPASLAWVDRQNLTSAHPVSKVKDKTAERSDRNNSVKSCVKNEE